MKFDFVKPKKNRILIYDEQSTRFANILFPKKNYEIIHTRRERINIYILIITIFKTGFKNLKNNYKKNFINCVSPKLVLCAVDQQAGFYNLKEMCGNPKYISIQNGLCSKDRYEKFYKYCRKYHRENKKKLTVDHSFVYSKTEKSILSKIINTKIHIVGSVLNNEFPLNLKDKKYRSILFIATTAKGHRNFYNDFKVDKKIFGQLIEFVKSNKIKLYYLDRPFKNGKSLLLDAFPKESWEHISELNRNERYQLLNKQQLVVFNRSSLGFEAMAKGTKCLQFANVFPIKGYYKKYNKSGKFWTNSLNPSNCQFFLNKMFNLPNSKWKKITRPYSKEIIGYDPYNSKIKKIINKILRN